MTITGWLRAAAVRHPVALSFSASAGCLVALLLVLATLQGLRLGGDDPTPITRLGRQLVPKTPTARIRDDALEMSMQAGNPTTVLAIVVPPFNAADYGQFTLEASTLPNGVEVLLLWVRSGEPRRIYGHQLDFDRRLPVPTLLDRDPEWRGEIVGLALGVKGALDTPWKISAVGLLPPAPGAVLRDMLTGWTSFEPWDGRSINVLFGGREEQRTYLPPLVFIAAVTVIVLFRRWDKRQALPPVLLVLPIIAGWLLLDLRWQAQLLEQARVTYAEFGELSWEERHLQMEDGDLFGFIQEARKLLPPELVRIFATSDFDYFRLRAGYHLYPHNVLAFDWADPGVLRPGDYLLLYQKSDVRFDPASNVLIWPENKRVAVAPLTVRSGAGLFEIK